MFNMFKKKPYTVQKVQVKDSIHRYVCGVYNIQRLSAFGKEIRICGMFRDDVNYDGWVASSLNLHDEEYQWIMIKKFNAQVLKPYRIIRYLKSMMQVSQLYFLTKEDAEAAKDWIESQLILQELLK